MTVDIEKLEALISTSKVGEALELAQRMWRPRIEKTHLGTDELRLLIITGTLLNRKGFQRPALGYLSRFHCEYETQPRLPENHHLYEWGELLYLGLVETVTLKLQEEFGKHDNRDELVEKELANLKSAQMSKAQAKASPKKPKAAPSAFADRKAKAAKAASAASGGGCGTVMALVLSGSTVLLGLLIIAMHVLRAH